MMPSIYDIWCLQMNCNYSPKKNNSKLLQSEEGFVLIIAMLIMIVVSLLGIAALNTTTIETMIAGNEKFAQVQFFQADSGVNQFLLTGTQPSILTAQGAGFACKDDLPGANSVANFNPGGVAGNNVWVFYTRQIPSIPPIDEFRVCANGSNGRSIASLTVGVDFGLAPGGLPGSGGQEY